MINRQRFVILMASIVLILGVGGGFLAQGDWVYSEQAISTLVWELPLAEESLLGQSFVARQAGLQGVSLLVHLPNTEAQRQLIFKLYTDVGQEAILRQATVSTAGLVDGGYLQFNFEPIVDSYNHYYYFTLQTQSVTSEGDLAVHLGPLNTYVNGAAYRDGLPQDAQMVFNVSYHRPSILLDVGRRLLASFPATLLVLAMLLLPGATVLVWLSIPLDLDGLEWLALMTGLSLSLYPLIIALLRYLPITLSSPRLYLLFIFLGFLCIRGVWRHRARYNFLKEVSINKGIQPVYIALGVVLLFSWGVRLGIIQGLEAPLWADSYHHTMLSQVIVAQGKLSANWEPYLPLQSVNYHFGFHSMVAIFHWLVGQTLPQSVLIFGQLLNFLAVVMAYLVGRRFGGSAWVGVFAALITGLISQTPMFYVNWGRYTQLAGQIILPPLIVSTWLLLQHKAYNWSLILLNVLLLTGLGLTHYRVVMFYPCFVLPLLLMRWYEQGWTRTLIIEDIRRLSAVGVGALLLLFPRLVEFVGGRLWNTSLEVAKQGMNNSFTRDIHNAQLNILDYVQPPIFMMAWLGLALASWQRKLGVFVIGAWWATLFFLANPHLLGLPGAGLITNFATHIGAYLVFSILAGFSLGEVTKALIKINPFMAWGVLLLVIGVAFLGAKHQLKELNTQAILVTPPDLQAMHWIKTHTSEDAQFLVNSRISYGGWIVAGTDAGWWIPLLAGRQNTVPPLIYNMETPPYPNYVEDIAKTYHNIRQVGLSEGELAHRMIAHNLSYVYIGQQRGAIWQGDEAPLDPTWFMSTSLFKPVYVKDGVRIFYLDSGAVDN